jgi:hypothetical protein
MPPLYCHGGGRAYTYVCFYEIKVLPYSGGLNEKKRQIDAPISARVFLVPKFWLSVFFEKNIKGVCSRV